jgi:hypothetical protein
MVWGRLASSVAPLIAFFLDRAGHIPGAACCSTPCPRVRCRRLKVRSFPRTPSLESVVFGASAFYEPPRQTRPDPYARDGDQQNIRKAEVVLKHASFPLADLGGEMAAYILPRASHGRHLRSLRDLRAALALGKHGFFWPKRDNPEPFQFRNTQSRDTRLCAIVAIAAEAFSCFHASTIRQLPLAYKFFAW